MELVTDTSAMRQISNMTQCPSIDGDTMVNIVIVCLILAYTAETHSYLVESGLVERLRQFEPKRQQRDTCGMK